MFCHIVPVTYQKKWAIKGTKSNIYYFDKNLNPKEKDDKRENLYDARNGGKANSFMGKWDYYIITKEDKVHFEYIDTPSRCIEDYFGESIENEWSKVYELFIEGNCHKNKRALNEIITTSIYDFWKDKYVQHNYNIFAVSYTDMEVYSSVFENLDKFIALQYFRRYENMKPYFSEFFQEYLQDIIPTNELMRACYLKILFDCAKNVKANTLERFLLAKDLTFTTAVIFATGKNKFILSDNPVIFNSGDIPDISLPGGLYMAISPEVAIALLNLSELRKTQSEMDIKDLLLIAESDDFVLYYNRLLLEKSISTVGFNSINIKDHIANDLTKSYSFNVLVG